MVCRAAEHPSVYPSPTTAESGYKTKQRDRQAFTLTLTLTPKDAGDLRNKYKKKVIQLTCFVRLLSHD